MKKTFRIAVLAILVLGGGAILAILYFTGSPAQVPGMTDGALAPPAKVDAPVVPGATGPTGAPVERELPKKLLAPAGVPMVPEPDPRAEKMEAERAVKFESAIDAQNRRVQERIRKAEKLRQQGAPGGAPAPTR